MTERISPSKGKGFFMINPKKELFKWGPIEFRLFYGSFFVEALWLHVFKHYSWPWPPFWFIYQDGRALFVCEHEELRGAGAKYFKKYFLNLRNYKKQWAMWGKWIKEYEKRAAKYEQTNFSKVSDSELLNLFKDFYKFNIDFWLVVHVPEIANWGGEWMLRGELKKVDKEKVDEYLEILSAPIQYSFFQKEELDLLKIAKDGNLALEKHAGKYYWLLNSYGGDRILRTDYFVKEIRELSRGTTVEKKIAEIRGVIVKNKKRKQNLIKELHLGKKTSLMAKQLAQSIWWQDLRKGYVWRLQYLLDKFLKEIAKRTSWRFNDLLWCWPEEVIKIFEHKKVDRQKILSRRKNYAVYLGGVGDIKHLYSKEAQKLLKIYQPKVRRGVKELEGLAVSRGAVVQGRVKIIRDPFRDLEKMKRGDILVAAMTSPEFIVAMRKAAAVVTDHGGMTSHAAIVSRELGIPCIVGTKIATKVLKDGDLVEVDAEKGVVRKI